MTQEIRSPKHDRAVKDNILEITGKILIRIEQYHNYMEKKQRRHTPPVVTFGSVGHVRTYKVYQ